MEEKEENKQIEIFTSYEKELREATEKELGIKIPNIPENINTAIEVRFLEELLILNGKKEIADKIWHKYESEISHLLREHLQRHLILNQLTDLHLSLENEKRQER